MMGRQLLPHSETMKAGSPCTLLAHFHVTFAGWGVLWKPALTFLSAPEDVFASCTQTAA